LIEVKRMFLISKSLGVEKMLINAVGNEIEKSGSEKNPHTCSHNKTRTQKW
jgi:hypothetical protein